MGDLAYWMDENFLYSLFVPTGALQTVKIIRNKASNASEGYGFVEFASHAAAEDVLHTLNGTPIPNTDQIFRLNWAAFGVGKQTPEGADNSKPCCCSCRSFLSGSEPHHSQMRALKSLGAKNTSWSQSCIAAYNVLCTMFFSLIFCSARGPQHLCW